MRFETPLRQARLIRRYKRFLADVELPDGSQLTMHCPNSGSMRTCSEPGSPVAYSTSTNAKRKYPHTLEMVNNGTSWIGVNTSLTNRLVVEAIAAGSIGELGPFDHVQQEVKTSAGNRLDILLKSGDNRTYIEVKNCSLVEHGCAQFPDAVTTRGTKHLNELARLVEHGHRSIIFYLVQRSDAHLFCPADHIDPVYGQTLREVVDRGVEVLAYQADVSVQEISVVGPLPVQLAPTNHQPTR